MHILESIWTDIRNGENIDLYLTVLIALGVAALSLLGINVSSFIAPLTLAILGLLAISNLVNRHHLEKIVQKQAQSITGFFSNEYPPDFNAQLESGKEVWLVGVTLNRTIKNNYIKLEEKLQQGHTLKILLVNPTGAPIGLAASRNYAQVNRDPEIKIAEIKATLQLFCSLKKISPDKIEIRTVENPLSYGATCINPDSATGVLYLDHYPFRTASDSIPKFTLRASDGYWYDFLKGNSCLVE
ncbi:MAG: hypothetical protein HS126_21865 [Anaerolineales bacterium]|nr:hypothetical protein [Anaerolineales bacterium]